MRQKERFVLKFQSEAFVFATFGGTNGEAAVRFDATIVELTSTATVAPKR